MADDRQQTSSPAHPATATGSYDRAIVVGRFHLAQVNIALSRAPIESELMVEFVALLEPVNALADASPGFVGRLQTEEGDATAIRAFGDDRLIVNMSVWESLEALGAFVYGGRHVDVLRRRREWFERLGRPFAALWWLPAGQLPTVADAELRVARLELEGPTPNAFTFKHNFPVPFVADGVAPSDDDRWLCPA